MASTTKVPLKYLFTVVYKDGTRFSQNKEDVSSVDPSRSAYFDVRQEDVKRFFLDDGNGNGGEVDLATGFLSGTGTPGFTEDIGPKPYKLIFWRQHTHNFNIGLDELSHEIKYILGYEDSNGVEHTIVIK